MALSGGCRVDRRIEFSSALCSIGPASLPALAETVGRGPNRRLEPGRRQLREQSINVSLRVEGQEVVQPLA